MLSLGTLNIAVPLSSGCLGIIYYTLYTLALPSFCKRIWNSEKIIHTSYITTLIKIKLGFQNLNCFWEYWNKFATSLIINPLPKPSFQTFLYPFLQQDVDRDCVEEVGKPLCWGSQLSLNTLKDSKEKSWIRFKVHMFFKFLWSV